MPKLTFTSSGGTIECTLGELAGNNPYTIANIEGLAPADAQINLTEMALNDGAFFNSAKVMYRTINVALAIEYMAEEWRLNAYKVFRPKKPIRIDYKSARLDVFIEGYVKRVSVPHFDMKQILTVEIVCPYPYFKAAQEIKTELNKVVRSFHMPFAIEATDPVPLGYMQSVSNVTVTNDGEAETPLKMIFRAQAPVTNPKVTNYVTGDFFGLDITMSAADEITIDGEDKTVTLVRAGVASNIFNYISKDITWLTLEQGANTFTYSVDSGDPEDLIVDFYHYDLHTGV